MLSIAARRRRSKTSSAHSRPMTSPRSASAISRRLKAATPSPISWRSWSRKAASSHSIKARPKPVPARLAIARSSRNPCDRASARERLNERVKYREAIRPLAPMATLEAAREYFELLPGASDADYNAYNYMVLTAHSKPHARDKIPAVIHADGTGRIQIVRAEDDPSTYAYLKALGRHIGVELSVNTLLQCRRPDRADAAAGNRYAAPFQGARCRRAWSQATATVHAAWHGGERDSGRFETGLPTGRRHRLPASLRDNSLLP